MSGETGGGYGLSPSTGLGAGESVAPALAYLPPKPRAYRPKIALIGCGGIAEYHLRAYRALGLDVVALCDREPARAEKRRAEFYPQAAVSADYREVLRRDNVEIVDVATHPHERIEIIEAALQAGKHVLSQKPFVLDLAEGRRLVTLAREKGRKLAVNQNGRWAPHHSWLAAAVHSGLVGDVATIDFTLQWDHTWTTGTAFEDVRHLVLFDFGIHWFDATARLMRGKTPQRVWASAVRTSFQKMQPPILAQAVIDYADAQVRLNFNGHVKYGQEDRTVICGSRGTLRSFGPSLSEQAVVLQTAEGEARPKLEGTWFANGFQGAMAELICAIEDDRAPGHDAGENLASLALCFAAVASADEGRPVVPGTVEKLGI